MDSACETETPTGGSTERPVVGLALRRWLWVATVVVIGVVALASWVELAGDKALDDDELQHMHVAWCLTQGLTPYRDFWDNHPPGLHRLLGPVVRSADRPSEAFRRARGWALVWGLAPLLGVCLLGRATFGRACAVAGLVWLVFCEAYVIKAVEIRPGPWMVGAVVFAAWLLVGAMGRRSASVRLIGVCVSGVVLGVGFLFSAKVVVVAVVFGAAIPIARWAGALVRAPLGGQSAPGVLSAMVAGSRSRELPAMDAESRVREVSTMDAASRSRDQASERRRSAGHWFAKAVVEAGVFGVGFLVAVCVVVVSVAGLAGAGRMLRLTLLDNIDAPDRFVPWALLEGTRFYALPMFALVGIGIVVWECARARRRRRGKYGADGDDAVVSRGTPDRTGLPPSEGAPTVSPGPGGLDPSESADALIPCHEVPAGRRDPLAADGARHPTDAPSVHADTPVVSAADTPIVADDAPAVPNDPSPDSVEAPVFVASVALGLAVVYAFIMPAPYLQSASMFIPFLAILAGVATARLANVALHARRRSLQTGAVILVLAAAFGGVLSPLERLHRRARLDAQAGFLANELALIDLVHDRTGPNDRVFDGRSLATFRMHASYHPVWTRGELERYRCGLITPTVRQELRQNACTLIFAGSRVRGLSAADWAFIDAHYLAWPGIDDLYLPGRVFRAGEVPAQGVDFDVVAPGRYEVRRDESILAVRIDDRSVGEAVRLAVGMHRVSIDGADADGRVSLVRIPGQ